MHVEQEACGLKIQSHVLMTSLTMSLDHPSSKLVSYVLNPKPYINPENVSGAWGVQLGFRLLHV